MCDQAIYSPIATRNISSRSYGHCNQAGASHGSQLESEFLECSKDTDLPPTESGKKKKFATTPDNGLELNVNAFGMMDASTYSCIVRAVFLAWVGAKALPHCNFDSVRTGVL